MGQPIDIRVPDIGDFRDVPVIDMLVRIGDRIAVGTPLVTLESDKATMDIPSPRAGVVSALRVAVGDRVSEGVALLQLDVDVSGPAVVPVAPVAPQPAAPPAETRTGPPRRSGLAHASPSVRGFARELGVDLARVTASDPRGRISKADVVAFIKASLKAPFSPAATARRDALLDLLPWPEVDFAKFGPVERRPRSRVQRISAANLHRNWVMVPHVTNFDEAYITELETFRQTLNRERGPADGKLTLRPFLLKAVVGTLQAYPAFNSSLDGDTIVEKRYWHVGFATDTPDGLRVPVVRDVHRKRMAELARECAELARLARAGQLEPEQIQGGTFTVSSLGGIGGTGFTPIINAPQVAILGVTRSRIQPAWDGAAFQPHQILPLCLSWDHRAVDGVAAARFLVHLARLLGDVRRLLV